MIKIMGCVLLVAAFNIMGQKIAESRRKRLTFIENMILAVSDFFAAVEIFSLPVPEALEKSGINKAAELLKKSDFAKSEDIEDYEVFVKGLCAETLKGQLSNAGYYRKKLEKEDAAEREKYKSESKLIRGGFLLMGILAAIILI